MCGILMTLGESHSGFNNALDLMKHRGPDAQKVEMFDTKSGFLSLGHVRLSIHDLDVRSEQPFITECGQYVLIFNGEIYNFEELKKSLLPDEMFKTTSDTEVLILLLKKYGKNILNDLDGMFAFCFYNKYENSILIARDQLGIKPIYYSYNNGELIIASEIKPILSLLKCKPKISQIAMYEFMRNSFIYEPETGFDNILKLPSGYLVELDLRGVSKFEPQKYWCPIDIDLNNRYSILKQSIKELDNLVKESVELQQKSDVPVGLFFSGGVDSTILLSKLSSNKPVDILSVKHQTSYVKKSGGSDDFYYACQISKHLDKKIKPIEFSPVLDTEAFLTEVKYTAIGVEELVADFTFSVSKKLSQEAREKNSVVMLSGLGADEIFAGYEKYRLLQYPFLYRTILFLTKPLLKRNKSFAKKFERLIAFFRCSDFNQSYSNLLGYFSNEHVNALFKNGSELEQIYLKKLSSFVSPDLSNLRKAMMLDLRGFLQHNFTVGDKSSMAASIELRVPLATKNLMEASFSTPDNKLLSLSNTKISLRNLLKGIVPKKFLERKKAGFHPPMDTVINNLGSNRLVEVWTENQIFDVLDKNFCIDLLNEHFIKNKNNTYQIFQITFFSYWYSHFIVEDNYAAS